LNKHKNGVVRVDISKKPSKIVVYSSVWQYKKAKKLDPKGV
jgi:hypothetical protein